MSTKRAKGTGIGRREFVTAGIATVAFALSPAVVRAAYAAAPATAGEGPYGPLQPPDHNGLMLPVGFTSREIAKGGDIVTGTTYPWHIFSDGQATYRTIDGGWILVANSESLSATGAGVSAMRFLPNGRIESAYRILGGTNVNCAGGPTPWGTWLSCEEYDYGMVWECDPSGVLMPAPRPAMGVFTHEAAAVDPLGERVYLTEDEGDGGFYRFTPDAYPDLSTGMLEVAVVRDGGTVEWREVPDPTIAMSGTPTRQQVPDMTRFRGGEGAWYANGIVYFTTKGDRKVWAYDTHARTIDVLFDGAAAPDSSLNAVDNVTVSPYGDVYVCEDGGNMEIGLITPDRKVSPFLRFVGENHVFQPPSEVAGVVFDPSGTRMYFSSQRAYPLPSGGLSVAGRLPTGLGAVYEVTGPFRLLGSGVQTGFGPPAGELRPHGPLAPGSDTGAQFAIRVRSEFQIDRSTLLSLGLGIEVELDAVAEVALALSSADLVITPGLGGKTARPLTTILARRRFSAAGAGRMAVRLELDETARDLLRTLQGAFDARITVHVRKAKGGWWATTRIVQIIG